MANLEKLIDDFWKGKTPEEVLGEGGLLKDLTKRACKKGPVQNFVCEPFHQLVT